MFNYKNIVSNIKQFPNLNLDSNNQHHLKFKVINNNFLLLENIVVIGKVLFNTPKIKFYQKAQSSIGLIFRW